MMGRKNFRLAIGVSALLGLGLLLEATPASAAPPPHARAHGYYKNKSRGYSSYRPSPYRYGGSRYDRSPYYSRYRRNPYDLDRDGIPNRRDRDIDGDGIRNSRDRYDYSHSRYPREKDWDRDGVRNRYDRHDYNRYRR